MNMSIPMAFFLDIETTGIDPVKEEIIEVGFALVDTFNWSIEREFSTLISTPQFKDRVDNDGLEDFITHMHTKSGLLHDFQSYWDGGAGLERTVYSYEEYEAILLGIVKTWGVKNTPVWGSSVGFDRKFLEQKMPAFNDYFHYRVVDSSSVMERLKLTKPDLWRWVDNDPQKYKSPEGAKLHRPLEDLRHSISMEERLDKWVYKPAMMTAPQY